MTSTPKLSATFLASDGLGNENIGENREDGFLKFCEEAVAGGSGAARRKMVEKFQCVFGVGGLRNSISSVEFRTVGKFVIFFPVFEPLMSRWPELVLGKRWGMREKRKGKMGLTTNCHVLKLPHHKV